MGNTLVEEILLIISKLHEQKLTSYEAKKEVQQCMDMYGINPHLHKGVSKMLQRLRGADYFSRYQLFISKLHWIIASLAAKAYDVDYAKAFIVEELGKLTAKNKEGFPKLALKEKTMSSYSGTDRIFEEIKEVLRASDQELSEKTELASIDIFSEAIDQKIKEYSKNIV